MKAYIYFILGVCAAFLGLGIFAQPAEAAPLRAWGGNTYGEGAVPLVSDFVGIGAGYWHSAALRADGALAAWGDNLYGQCNVPAGSDFVSVTAGAWHNVALKSDGSLAAWGRNDYNQCTVPAGTNFAAIAAGGFHSLALTSDGTVRAWGQNTYGQCNVPVGNGYLAVAGGAFHSLAISGDGTLRAWGQNTYGQCNVPVGSGYLAVAGGAYHSMAIASDGSLRAWGRNDLGQCNVPAGNTFAAISCGERFSLALTSDGTLWAWGRNDSGQCNVPAGSAFSVVSAGWFHVLALESIPALPSMNHEPVAIDQSVTIDEDTPAGFTLQAADEDGDVLSYEVLVAPAYGVLGGALPDLTYEPNPEYHGPDAFTFQVSDGQALSNVATVNIVVNAVNDPPVASALVNGQASVTLEEASWEGTTVTLDASGSSDLDGDTLSYEWDFTSDGTVDATGPIVDVAYVKGGPYTAVVRVTDPDGASSTATVTITITAGSALHQLDILYGMLQDSVTNGAVAPQVVSSLTAKINAVSAALAKGTPQSLKAAANNANALVKFIQAQSGKKIDAQTADEMIARLASVASQLGWTFDPSVKDRCRKHESTHHAVRWHYAHGGKHESDHEKKHSEGGRHDGRR
ncbi:MAG: cadherin-like domain-containing protein [Candidatus Hydrogenedentes bacterium]|nr:cadherin-like domain-containing protein [Candidatus Hydrogenedentota bacterium]